MLSNDARPRLPTFGNQLIKPRQVGAVSNNDKIVFMGKLDTSERKSLPSSDFGEPGARKYPIPDRSHAANAKSRAKEMLNKGHISQAEYDKICAKANKELAK